MRLSVCSYEPYVKERFSDNFGSKPNPFRLVCHCLAEYQDGNRLIVTLKFKDTNQNDSRSLERARQFLKEYDLYEEEQVNCNGAL